MNARVDYQETNSGERAEVIKQTMTLRRGPVSGSNPDARRALCQITAVARTNVAAVPEQETRVVNSVGQFPIATQTLQADTPMLKRNPWDYGVSGQTARGTHIARSDVAREKPATLHRSEKWR